MRPQTVQVNHNRRGDWEIALPGEQNRVTCGTLAEALRTACQCAIQRQPCNLIVIDAYHRVLRDELIDQHEQRATLADLGR